MASWKDGPRICLASPGVGGKIHQQAVQDVVDREASKEDNLGKLRQRIGLETHLAVVVEWKCFEAWAALNDLQPDATPVTLPGDVSHVWAMARVRGSDGVVCWRAAKSQPWDVVAV